VLVHHVLCLYPQQSSQPCVPACLPWRRAHRARR
jgi:hypothetical protein